MAILAVLFFATSVFLVLYQFKDKLFGIEETHLSPELFERNRLGIEIREDRDALPKDKARFFLSNKFKYMEGRIPLPTAGLKRKLIKAGRPMGVLEFLAFKVLMMVLVPVLGFIFLSNNFSPNTILLASLAIGYLFPEFWLRGKIKKRQAGIIKELPAIIDLLNLCVSGGLDFMLAVNRVVKDLKKCDLTLELAEVYRETQMGKARREALKNFAWRVDIPEVHSFVRTLVQADRMGTPMSEALSLQAEEIRVRRFQRGESMALKAPIKLLFPLFVFILPVVLIIVGGPIMLQFMRGGLQLGF